MMYTRTFTRWLAGILLMMGLLLGYHPVLAQSPIGTTVPQQSVVRAVLFWMDTCGNCHYILEKVLPPLQSKYGDQLEIFLIEIKSAEDIDLLYQTGTALGLRKEKVGVPFLMIGDRVLIGYGQIPEELPGLIETYLAQGGVDYPQIETIVALLPTPAAQRTVICAPSTPCADDAAPTAAPAATNPSQPPAVPPLSNGFALAVAVIVGMAGALVYTSVRVVRGLRQGRLLAESESGERWRSLVFSVLCLIGLGSV